MLRKRRGQVHENLIQTGIHLCCIFCGGCRWGLFFCCCAPTAVDHHKLEPETGARNVRTRTKMGMRVNLRASHYRKALVTHSTGLAPSLKGSLLCRVKSRGGLQGFSLQGAGNKTRRCEDNDLPMTPVVGRTHDQEYPQQRWEVAK